MSTRAVACNNPGESEVVKFFEVLKILKILRFWRYPRWGWSQKSRWFPMWGRICHPLRLLLQSSTFFFLSELVMGVMDSVIMFEKLLQSNCGGSGGCGVSSQQNGDVLLWQSQRRLTLIATKFCYFRLASSGIVWGCRWFLQLKADVALCQQ